MNTVTVCRCRNGWIVKKGMEEYVYLKEEDMLLEVYRSICEWEVGKRVQITTEEPRRRQW